MRQYEPFFSATHAFEFDVRIGVSPIPFYDPLQRAVATLNPNHTWQKVLFDPWHQETWDVNDTLLINPDEDAEVGDYVRRLNQDEYLPTWHSGRIGGAMGAQEQAAAQKTEDHANTPAVAHMDSLGRTFLTIAHNRVSRDGGPIADEFNRTRIVFDIEGNQREVIDALDRIVMQYDYDTLGNQIHSSSMEAGERWMLNDVAGKALYGWNSRDHRLRTNYDVLARPTEVYLQKGIEPELLVGRTVYGETQLDPETNNLRGKVYQSFDGAGVVMSEEYDFKGNVLRSNRQLAAEYKKTVDWSKIVALESEVFTSSTVFDALNRTVTLTTPDHSVIRPTYNEANLLEQVNANLRGSTTVTMFVSDIDYNAKGQRELIVYGNSVSTTYDYDPLAFRLIRLHTLKGSESLQDLSYTYDPTGNITEIREEAQQTIYFRNTRVEPSAKYTYDAIYQLIEATSREHLGQTDGQPNPPTAPDAFNLFHTGHDQPGDRNAMGIYRESYVYDTVGNFLEMQHVGSDPAHPGWTRSYDCAEASLIEDGMSGTPLKFSNRLSRSTVGNGNPMTEQYTYDAHGSMTSMAHLQPMQWDFKDQLQMTQRPAVNAADEEGAQHQGERTYYVYDGGGQRVRKVTELATGQIKDERIYLGGFELYRKRNGNGNVTLERETLHIMDDKQRIALVETKTIDTQSPVLSPCTGIN